MMPVKVRTFTMPARMLALLATAALGALLPPVAAQGRPPAALLAAADSEIVFSIRQMGVPVEGRFGRFDARIALDPKHPETGSVGLTIDTGSARFGSPELDTEIGKPGWLDVAHFPQAIFQSSAIRATGPGRFELTGQLRIKGAARDIVVPVQLTSSGAASTAAGAFTIRRLDFKVGDGDWSDTSLLANDVAVRFKLALTGVPPP
jgi:polyisoprenoid-binding protein YceI